MANELSPSEVQARLQEALALHQKGRIGEAESIYDEILRHEPGNFDALHLSGVAAYQTKQYERSVERITKAIARNPRSAPAHSNLGNAWIALKRYPEALTCLEQAIALNANDATAHNNRGIVLHHLGRRKDSLAGFNRAIALRPEYAEAYNNRGNLLNKLGCQKEALDDFDTAIAQNPKYAQAYYNRAIVLANQGRLADALADYDKAIAVLPQYPAALYNRGSLLNELDRPKEALENYDRALALQPDAPFLFGDVVYTKLRLCEWDHLDQNVAELARRLDRGEPASSPFPTVAAIDSPAQQKIAAELYAAARFPLDTTLSRFPDRVRLPKIRIGYFSADFHDHATAHLMAELFERHDRSRFEWFAFSFGPRTYDDMQLRLVPLFNDFADVSAESDLRAAAGARNRRIDIAVDLKGYTKGHRLGIFAHRAAPVQVSYLGYPGTIGADYMDYLIADRIVIPESDRAHYSEKIVYLPNSYQCNDTRRLVADETPSRAELGLPDDAFVFCCFNNNYKILPDLFDCWMRILKTVDRSVLWLFESDSKVSIRLRNAAQQGGVAAERLVFATHMPTPQHRARYRVADLFLDTLPYNAHTTASDALWAGLPVLTHVGTTFAGRVAASLLTAIGLPELIAPTREAYEALAITLARDSARLAHIKRRLADNRLSTPLFDTGRFARHMEAAYLEMYERYQAGLTPDHIIVSPD